MKPLAYRLRPKTLDDIIGQEKVKKILEKMIKEEKISSFILYGPPGVGKTSIAEIMTKEFPLNHFIFNAGSDSKAKLKKQLEDNDYYDSVLLVIDEIHRMKKDTQDYLLPFVESGKAIIIGLTTENPYHAVNPAIRSRLLMFKLNKLSLEDIVKALKKAINSNELKKVDIDDDVLKYVANASNGEIRYALNALENIVLFSDDKITIDIAINIMGKPSLSLDKNGDNYYQILSALQKSIRGSDVNASLHYLARLIAMGDLISLNRRLIVIAYEDIGLANPQIGPRVMAATKAAIEVGFPEARIPLGVIVCDMALSPKSNSAHKATDMAYNDFISGKGKNIPPNIINSEIKAKNAIYKYPHDYPGGYVKQQYLPDDLINVEYFDPKDTSTYERALKKHYENIKKINSIK